MEKNRSNLYRETPRFVKHYVGRKAAQEELMEKLCKGVNTVVMGVEGVGKSAFLTSVLTPEYCRQMALEKHILINQISYPTDLATEDIYPFFAESVRDAADILDECGEQDLYEDIMNQAERYQEKSHGPQSYFQSICKYISRKTYHVVLVIDQFERFTSSKHVLAEHHDVMRNVLAEKNLCFVVATDYDFNKGSLPQNAAGSLLLQLFAGHEIPLKGLDPEECRLFLRGIGGQDDFTQDELDHLCLLTGGIPVLLCRAAYYTLAQKEKGEEISWRGVKVSVLQDCGRIMDRWLGVLTAQEAGLLHELAKQDKEAVSIRTDLRDGAAPLLLDRGLIVDLGDHCYNFNSLLFQTYCIQHPPESRLPDDLLTLRPTPEPQKPSDWPVPGPWSWPNDRVVIYNTNVHAEGNIESGAVQIQNISIPDLSVSNILGMLEEGKDIQTFLAARLTECRNKGQLPALTYGLPEAEQAQLDQIYDEAFSKIGSDFLTVEVDESQYLSNISAQEQDTLDERFAQARTRCSRNLSDELLASVSERCRLYLKLSLVVEDALSILNNDTMQDCSPHLVLYGKALEQTLRDNLFELFQREERLSAYDTYAYHEDKYSPNSFGNKRAEKTYIGNFTCLINSQRKYLGKLCAQAGIRAQAGNLIQEEAPSIQQWGDWWKELRDQIDEARSIRNLADHPDKQLPTASDLERMCELLLGTAEKPGVLARTAVGKMLFLSLFPPKVDYLTGKSLEGSQAMFRCMERTKRGGLKGRLDVTGYEASVSPLQVERYCSSLPGADFEPVGALLKAVILEYKTEGDRCFFNLELLT